MHTNKWILAGLVALSLAACGRTVGERAVIGGGAGAIGSAAFGGDPVAGAVVGAGTSVAFCELYPRHPNCN